jgi:hypothetical protein
MPYGNETPEVTKKIEDCVSKLTGNNKRTGQPYTKSEKIAICKSSLQKGKAAVDEEDKAPVENSMSECVRKQIKKGKSPEQAKSYCEALLAKANYEPKTLTFILDGIS